MSTMKLESSNNEELKSENPVNFDIHFRQTKLKQQTFNNDFDPFYEEAMMRIKANKTQANMKVF